MEEKTATVIGATGLIGSHILSQLAKDNFYKHVRIITRRPVDMNISGIDARVIDFADNNAFREAISGSDAVFCAVGTTQKKVNGDKAEYRKIDYDIPVNAAGYCAETGCQCFQLVSSIGAKSSSGNFYLKLKGEVEDKVKTFRIPSVSVFRPSLLLGKRNEFRFAEKVSQFMMITHFVSKKFPVPASFSKTIRHWYEGSLI